MLKRSKSDIKRENMRILLSGWWYSELPPVLDFSKINENLYETINEIKNNKYDYYAVSSEGFVEKFKGISSPKYSTMYCPKYTEWTEPISYYSFKKEKNFREMQTPNLIQYLAFIYNSIYVFNDLFEKLYLDDNNLRYTENSNSYVVLGEYFTLHTAYEGLEEEDILGRFVSSNNKETGISTIRENQRRYNDQQKAYLYSTKLDIESFFPNIYTHNFEKIIKTLPYKDMNLDLKYFKFLDYFHQKTNNNQTKGIPAGLFSSHIAAELLMISVDEEIRMELDDECMGYIRYVDDMTFFSDDKNELDKVYAMVQKVLNKYRLRINGAKTEYKKNYDKTYNMANLEEVYRVMPYLKTENTMKFETEEFQQLKIYVAQQLYEGNISQIRTILTKLKKRVSESFGLLDKEIVKSLFCYLVMILFENVNLCYQVYQVMDVIIEHSKDKEFYISILKQKQDIIDEKYSDTIFQIWNYYLITKYQSDMELDNFWKERKGNITNPIIICFFVKEKCNGNKDIFGWIKEKYESEIENSSKWKETIMFSKWWLPILKIREKDKYNYYSFMESGNFPKILEKLLMEQECLFN